MRDPQQQEGCFPSAGGTRRALTVRRALNSVNEAVKTNNTADETSLAKKVRISPLLIFRDEYSGETSPNAAAEMQSN